MFKCNILIFNFCTLLTKSTNQPAPQTNQHHKPTSTTNQPARHEPTSKARTNQQNRHNKAQKAVSKVFV